jgi:hypothetical protein
MIVCFSEYSGKISALTLIITYIDLNSLTQEQQVFKYLQFYNNEQLS